MAAPKKAKKGALTVMEAMEELSRIAELDEREAASRFSEKDKEVLKEWTDPHQKENNQEKVRETFRVLHSYLQQVYEKEEVEMEDVETRRGVQAIMLMANEAAQKIDRCTALFKGLHGEGGVKELKEFKDLQEFYLNKIMKKFHAALAKEEAWEAEWGGGVEVDLLDIQRRGLKDLETVKRDKEYELFFIRKEDGKPFFSRNLLRHIKLVGKFDETLLEIVGEDPFLRLKSMEDRCLHESAREILDAIHPAFDAFVKDAVQAKDSPLVSSVIKAVMALMLAVNPRNLMQNTMGKSAVSYFHDFQLYLREAIEGEEYARAMEKQAEQLSSANRQALQLVHLLAFWLFTRHAHAGEGSVYVQSLFSRACQKYPLTTSGKNPLWVWNALVDEDEHLRQFLKKYPNGPLLKTLDVMRESEDQAGFDPLFQENLPCRLFTFAGDDIDCAVLRIPSPTIQLHIHQAKCTPEFTAFLRYLAGSKRKLLLVNLQDRTSWHEHARCVALDEAQKNAEFSEAFYVVNLPKDTEFYLQSGSYEGLDDAAVFCGQLLEQMASGESCGFSFPPALKMEDISVFAKKAVEAIHQTIFGGKDHLTRKNRLDFIELFYHFLTLKLVEMTAPDFLSFTCKDAIDTGAATTAGFYAFLKIMSGQPDWRQQDKEFLYRILYQSALIMRERPIDDTRLHRLIGAFAAFQAELEDKKAKLQETCSALYKRPIFKDLKIN